jgi:integrase
MTRSVKPTTHAGYSQVVRDYLVPHIGGVVLQDLVTAHISALYGTLLERGGKGQLRKSKGVAMPRAHRPLSRKTVRNVHLVLTKALNDAVDDGLLAMNPANRAKKPTVRLADRQVQAWSEGELSCFLDAASRDDLFPLWHVAAFTGLRRGELLGLRWQDLDLDKATLAVRQTIVLVGSTPTIGTPKNNEARVLDLDPDTMAVVRRHRTKQIEQRLAWGKGYIETGLVFTREDGRGHDPDRVRRLFDRAVKRSNIRRITLHGLRHTHATILLKNGVPVKVVSERLGHSDPAFTMRVYQHVLQGMQASAAATFAEVMRSADGLAQREGVSS